jgi:hypothetical protein
MVTNSDDDGKGGSAPANGRPNHSPGLCGCFDDQGNLLCPQCLIDTNPTQIVKLPDGRWTIVGDAWEPLDDGPACPDTEPWAAGTKAAFDGATEKPRPNVVNLYGIPLELRERPQWVCWKYELRDGKWTKIPIDPKTGRNAKANVRKTWGTFEQAAHYYRSHPDEIAGVGYEFHADDPFCGVDLDDALDPFTGALKPWAAQIVADFDTYTEISPSRTGVKLYLRGKKPGAKCRAKYADGEIEVYDQGRFFAVTGERWEGPRP